MAYRGGLFSVVSVCGCVYLFVCQHDNFLSVWNIIMNFLLEARYGQKLGRNRTWLHSDALWSAGGDLMSDTMECGWWFNVWCSRRRRRHRVVVEDRSVAPVWPRWMAARHRSAGGRWWSWRSWSIQRLRGRPELRTQSRSGRLPSDVSTCSRNAWWAGMLECIMRIVKFLNK